MITLVLPAYTSCLLAAGADFWLMVAPGVTSPIAKGIYINN